MISFEGLMIAAAIAGAGLVFSRVVRTVRNPITLVTLWWALWVAVSAVSPFGLEVPSASTYALFGLSLAGFATGALVQRTVAFRGIDPRRNAIWSSAALERTALVVGVALLVFLIGLSFVARSSVSLDADIRGAALGATDGPDPVFGDVRYRSLFNALVPGPLLLLVILGNWLYFYRSRVAVLLVAAACVGLYSVALYGRLWLQILVAVSGVAIVLASASPLPAVRARVRRGLAMVAALIVAALVTSWTLTQERADGKGGAEEAFVTFVHYHTFGFTLIDQELTNVTSWLMTEPATAGLLTTNGLHDVLAIAIRRLDPTYTNKGIDAIAYRQQFRTVGQWANRPVIYNAYYTFMFTVLADGGLFYAFAGPLLLGWWCMASYRRFVASSAFRPFFGVLLSVWLAVFSLFQSAVESSAFWTCLLTVNAIGLLARWFQHGGTEPAAWRPLADSAAAEAAAGTGRTTAARRPLVLDAPVGPDTICEWNRAS